MSQVSRNGALFAAALAMLVPATLSQAAVLWDQIGANYAPNSWIFDSQEFEPSWAYRNLATVDSFTLNAPASLTTLDAVVGGTTMAGTFTADSYNHIQWWHLAIYSSVGHAASTLTGNVADTTIASATSLVPIPSAPNYQSFATFDLRPAAITLPAGTYYLALMARLDRTYGDLCIGANGTNGDGWLYLANPGGGMGFGGNAQVEWDSNAAYRLSGDAVPEPVSLGLLAFGAPLLLVRRRQAHASRALA